MRQWEMRRDWAPADLIASWTLVDDDWPLLANKTGATRLGFALLLKFFEVDACFPRHAGEVPLAAVDYVAGQVHVPAPRFADYDQAATARLLPRLLHGRRGGPVFLTARRARVPLAAADLDPASG